MEKPQDRLIRVEEQIKHLVKTIDHMLITQKEMSHDLKQLAQGHWKLDSKVASLAAGISIVMTLGMKLIGHLVNI